MALKKKRLNPRFDGAFLIQKFAAICGTGRVLIPDLMGLF